MHRHQPPHRDQAAVLRELVAAPADRWGAEAMRLAALATAMHRAEAADRRLDDARDADGTGEARA